MGRVVPVTFQLRGALIVSARQVAVVGPFNGWDPNVNPLTKNVEGDWAATIYLPPGRTLYHFWVDGFAWLDPYDEGRVHNCWGAEYSVRNIR